MDAKICSTHSRFLNQETNRWNKLTQTILSSIYSSALSSQWDSEIYFFCSCNVCKKEEKKQKKKNVVSNNV
ncbi:hypothetical protein COB64_02995 [Candidatus Wolfebacteria bacterium]|nr:MAG: hypothetical protein COB64_02995 [Candidatus Wolfebacteria bacterium]